MGPVSMSLTAAWLDAVSDPLAVGTYAYADGAAHVLLSVASDAIVSTLSERRRDITLACLATMRGGNWPAA